MTPPISYHGAAYITVCHVAILTEIFHADSARRNLLSSHPLDLAHSAIRGSCTKCLYKFLCLAHDCTLLINCCLQYTSGVHVAFAA